MRTTRQTKRLGIQFAIGGLSLAAFIVAIVSLGLNVLLLNRISRIPAAEPVGLLRGSQLDPASPAAYAANLPAMGCPQTATALVSDGKPRIESARPGLAQGGSPSFVVPIGAAVPSSNFRFHSRVPVSSAPAAASQPDQQVPEAASATSTPVAGSSFAPAGDLEPSTSPRTRGGAGGSLAQNVSKARIAGLASNPAPAPARSEAFASASQVPGDASVITAPEGNAQIPAAFQEPSSALKLNPQQKEQLSQLQDQFVKDIGGVGQDPSNPDYLKSWQTAQWVNDERFKMLFGSQAFLAQQTEANKHTADNTSGQ